MRDERARWEHREDADVLNLVWSAAVESVEHLQLLGYKIVCAQSTTNTRTNLPVTKRLRLGRNVGLVSTLLLRGTRAKCGWRYHDDDDDDDHHHDDDDDDDDDDDRHDDGGYDGDDDGDDGTTRATPP